MAWIKNFETRDGREGFNRLRVVGLVEVFELPDRHSVALIDIMDRPNGQSRYSSQTVEWMRRGDRSHDKSRRTYDSMKRCPATSRLRSMKFTLSWLLDHLDTSASLTEIVDTLTRVGLEVESVDDPSRKYDGFVVASVIEAKPHPNADRLKVCIVEAGGGPVQVVCGAPNARTGHEGRLLSGRHVYSRQEDDARQGRHPRRRIERHAVLGGGARAQRRSRGDHRARGRRAGRRRLRALGRARRSGHRRRRDAEPPRRHRRRRASRAISPRPGLGSLKTPAPKAVAGAFDCPTRVHLDFAPADAHLCPAFALRLVRGVTNGPSPEWMQKRLRAIGLRPISALVDITNYITFDRGRPLHVFDFAKVKGDLTVRRARRGESVLALDGKSYALDESMVVIADANGVELIAGIMGGEHSGCDETTRDVLIESALWDPTNIAQTGRKLGIMTDARYRFERGVDPEFCVPGCDLATEFVLSICGGEPSRMVVAGDPSPPRRSIPFPYGEVERLLGVDIPREEGEAILARLGFGVARWNGRCAFVAAGRPGEGRRRRADPAHRRRRPRADRAPAPARRGRGEAGADAAAEAHAARQAHAGRAIAARGGDLVVRLEDGGGTVRRRRARRSRSPIRSRPTFPTCARASFRASSPPPSATRAGP